MYDPSRQMIQVHREPIERLHEQAGILSSFRVQAVYEVAPIAGGLSGIQLTERRLDAPYVKDYDSAPDSGPESWSERFDVSRWAFFSARRSGQRVGGAVVAFDTPGVDLLGGRRDLAVLWDLRVREEARRAGIATMLFEAACSWATSQGCRLLSVETQNINGPACRFYAARGCVLGAIHRFAYPELPDEVMLLWYKELTPGSSDSNAHR